MRQLAKSSLVQIAVCRLLVTIRINSIVNLTHGNTINEIVIKLWHFSRKKVNLKMLSVKLVSTICLNLNVLIQ